MEVSLDSKSEPYFVSEPQCKIWLLIRRMCVSFFVLREADGQPNKGLKKGGGRDLWPNERMLSRWVAEIRYFYFHGRAQNRLDPNAAYEFKKYTLRHAQVRERKVRRVVRSSTPVFMSEAHKLPKFEDRSQEEISRHERCDRRDAWDLAKSIFKLKEQETATFFSLSDVWSHP